MFENWTFEEWYNILLEKYQNQNYNYEMSILLKSILPRTQTQTVEHTTVFPYTGIIKYEPEPEPQSVTEVTQVPRLPQEEKRPCLICKVAGIRKPVGRLKSGDFKWEVVHDDGKRCYWTEETDEQMWPLGELSF